MADPADKMNLSDMLELIKHGAEIKIDRPAQRIAQFDELIDAIKTMVASQEARANADLERSKVQLEVLARLQSLVNKKPGSITSPTIDISPLREVLTKIMESGQGEPVNYDFKILRSGPGLSPAHTIEARVVPPTKY